MGTKIQVCEVGLEEGTAVFKDNVLKKDLNGKVGMYIQFYSEKHIYVGQGDLFKRALKPHPENANHSKEKKLTLERVFVVYGKKDFYDTHAICMEFYLINFIKLGLLMLEEGYSNINKNKPSTLEKDPKQMAQSRSILNLVLNKKEIDPNPFKSSKSWDILDIDFEKVNEKIKDLERNKDKKTKDKDYQKTINYFQRMHHIYMKGGEQVFPFIKEIINNVLKIKPNIFRNKRIEKTYINIVEKFNEILGNKNKRNIKFNKKEVEKIMDEVESNKDPKKGVFRKEHRWIKSYNDNLEKDEEFSKILKDEEISKILKDEEISKILKDEEISKILEKKEICNILKDKGVSDILEYKEILKIFQNKEICNILENKEVSDILENKEVSDILENKEISKIFKI